MAKKYYAVRTGRKTGVFTDLGGVPETGDWIFGSGV
ncbi:MAG: viroplasmin family protein [Ruminococcus sp.]